ncbi:MAG: ABC transporter ATP-binding protein [Clostridia bacterium]|nr:ABC transporter ATP-binding protein [Clostridia bacterium]
MSNYVLECYNLNLLFKNHHAVKDFNLQVEKGKTYGLIGPNGAGKTTVLNLLTRVYKQNLGDIFINGKNTRKWDSTQINRHGIARTFQNIRLFKEMTVLENTMVGFHNNQKYSLFDSIFRTPKYFSEEKKIKNKSLELLSIFGMENKADCLSKNLSYGAQRMVEILRALATDPSILLLDEPAAGMNSSETMNLFEVINKIKNKFEISFIIIEHNMNFIMKICDYIYVLNRGETIAKGKPEEIQKNKEVETAYLGGQYAENK